MSSTDIYLQKKEQARIKNEAAAARLLKQKQDDDNVNYYAVKYKIGKRKVERAKMNAK